MGGFEGNFDQLWQQARAGDRDAIRHLAEMYEPEIRLVARAHLGVALRPYLDSLDLVQSVHRSLMFGIQKDQYEVATPQQLIALAATIVRHKVARHWRRARRQVRPTPLSEADDSGLSALLAGHSPTAEDPHAIAALREQIDQILLKLTTEERRLIEMRIMGYSTADAARLLGLDSDVCRVRLSRLRKRLRSLGIMEAI